MDYNELDNKEIEKLKRSSRRAFIFMIIFLSVVIILFFLGIKMSLNLFSNLGI